MTKSSGRTTGRCTDANKCNRSIGLEPLPAGGWRIDHKACTVHASGRRCPKAAAAAASNIACVVFVREPEAATEWNTVVAVDELPLVVGVNSRSTGYDAYSEAEVFSCQPIDDDDSGLYRGFKVVSQTSPYTEDLSDVEDDLEAKFDRQMSLSDSKPDVKIERQTFSKALVRWTSNQRSVPGSWLVSLTDCFGEPRRSTTVSYFFYVAGTTNEFEIPFQLTAGLQYRVGVRALGKNNKHPQGFARVSDESIADFRAELTMRDLQALYNKAVQFTGQLSMTPCNWLYRNRWKKYFGEIMNKRGGVMEVYDKDNSGDQASPINSRLKGLFFMAKNVNGLPPRDSPFGEIRLQVPPEVLLNAEPNLYFTDFYCMRSSMHYVTLVMTRPDSAADRFCRNRLLPLDIDDYPNNPFLFRRRGKLYTANRKKLQIELLYTENIDINDLVQRCGATVKDVPVAKNCKGRSTPGGVPKNKTCPLCNL